MKGLGIVIGVIVIGALIWFVAAQTNTEVTENGDDSVTASSTVDTDYSDDVARAEEEFATAYQAVEADVEAGVDASVEGLAAFVDSVEVAAEAAGEDAEAAFAEFIASARAQIEALRAQMPDVDAEVEVNAEEDGNASAQ